MNEEIIKIIAQGGSLSAIIVALVFLLRAIKDLIGARKNGELGKKIEEIETNHLKSLEERIDKLEDRVNNIAERLARLEARIYNKKKS